MKRWVVFVVFTAFGVLSVALGLAQAPASGAGNVAVYAAVGPDLVHYAVDVENATLVRKETTTLPGRGQEGWPHVSGRYLYVGWSTYGLGGGPGSSGLPSKMTGYPHGVTALRIDPATGDLAVHGKHLETPWRTVYMTTDIPSEHVIVAHHDQANPRKSAGITVARINADGTLGEKVPQPANLDIRVFMHSIGIHPSNRMVSVMWVGVVPSETEKENLGAIGVYGYKNGVLSNRAVVQVNGGVGYRPRHHDYHPTRPWLFVNTEATHQLHVYRILDGPDGPTLGPQPLFMKETMMDPKGPPPSTSAIHVHPNGRFVYVANRGKPSTIAVFSINQETGEPTLIENALSHGESMRSFDVDPSGRILVIGNTTNLAVFRIGSDGKLTFVKQYDERTGKEREDGQGLFWMGMVKLPGGGSTR